MDRLISIGELAELKAVSVDTIRRWEREGKIKSVTTDGGHRRYRLADFVEQAFELVFAICEYHGAEIIILNRKEDATFEEDLASDVLEIITVFSARLYSSRSSKNKKLLQNLAKSLEMQ